MAKSESVASLENHPLILEQMGKTKPYAVRDSEDSSCGQVVFYLKQPENTTLKQSGQRLFYFYTRKNDAGEDALYSQDLALLNLTEEELNGRNATDRELLPEKIDKTIDYVLDSRIGKEF